MRKVFHAAIMPAGLPSARVCENGQESELYAKFLCDALPSDFQEVEFCQEHLDSVLAVIRRKETSTEWVGNAFAIDVTKEATTFSNVLTGEKGGDLPTYEYLSALVLWMTFLQNPFVPLEGQLAATDEEAIRLVVP